MRSRSAKWPPLKPPPELPAMRYEIASGTEHESLAEHDYVARNEHSAAIAAFDDDIADRISALFERYGVATSPQSYGPSDDDWRILAIRLAIAHKEPGFVQEERTPNDKWLASKDDARHRRDSLMRHYIEVEGQNQADAAKSAVKHLNSEKSKGRFRGAVPAETTLRSEYSRRSSAKARGDDVSANALPFFLRHYLAQDRLIGRLLAVARRLTRNQIDDDV